MKVYIHVIWYVFNTRRDFDPKSMYRKPDPVCSEVTQLRGVRRDDGLELVITLLFDRSRFSEEQASEWGRLHCLRMGSIYIYL